VTGTPDLLRRKRVFHIGRHHGAGRRPARGSATIDSALERMGASARDLMAREVVCNCLQAVDRDYDVALAPPFEGGKDWSSADPADYSEVIFVCGPFGNGPPLTEFLERFAELPLVGINLSLLEPLEVWNPFDLLLECDSSVRARPDLAHMGGGPAAPAVGLVLIGSQLEYGERARHVQAHEAVDRVLLNGSCPRSASIHGSTKHHPGCAPRGRSRR
jgi:hypothetical protein